MLFSSNNGNTRKRLSVYLDSIDNHSLYNVQRATRSMSADLTGMMGPVVLGYGVINIVTQMNLLYIMGIY